MNERLPKIEAKKSLGQHFLNNTHVPALMAEAGNVQKDDIVLEIGPGTGVLTRELLKKGAKVFAIEADARAVASLNDTFRDDILAQNLTIIHDDVKNLDFCALGLRPHAYKLIANIPYYLSGFLFRMFLEHEIQPSTIVFLVQREVAERIARDKKESLLSLSIKVFGTPQYIKTVGKGNFTPAPKIDSAIILISDISKNNFHEFSQEYFFTILHEGFKSKRKQLLGNLSSMFYKNELLNIFSQLSIPADVRGEDLSLALWLVLTQHLHTQSTRPPQS